jgi:hypothetical protein
LLKNKKEELKKVKNSVNKEVIEKKIGETEKFLDISFLWREINPEVIKITNKLQEKRLKELEQELKPFNEYLAKNKDISVKEFIEALESLVPENLKEYLSRYLRIARLYLFLQEFIPQIIKAEYYSNGGD